MNIAFRIARLLVVSSLLAALVACGSKGSGGSSSANVRLVNATSSATLSLNLASASSTSYTAQITAIAAGAGSAYNGLTGGAYSANVVTSTNTLTPFTTAGFGFTGGTNYSVLAFERSGSVNAVNIPDTQVAPATGYANFRVYNTSLDAGVLDVYVLDTAAALGAGTAPTLSGLGAGIASASTPIPAGTYKVIVTAAGNQNQVRLNIPSIALADQQLLTLALISTTGGALVDGAAINQGGAVTMYRNNQARLRVVAAVGATLPVSATLGAQSLLGTGVLSPSVGTYALVSSGNQTLGLTINGVPSSSALLLAAGGDYTVLVYGAGASPAVTTLSDNNQALPSIGSLLNFRLINGLIGLNGTLALSLNYTQVATAVLPGKASAYGEVVSSAAPLIQLTASDPSFASYSTTGANLVSQGVYTMFVLGSPAVPVITIVKDR